MFIRLIIRFFFGYLRIEVEGYYIERFINICTNKKILIWNLKREKGVKLFLNIGIDDFKKISQIAKITSCKVKILRKRGIPFLLFRYKKRKIFAFFLCIMLCTVFISSRYVWNIEVRIEENLEVENIERDLEEIGLKVGMLKSKIDKEKIINEIRLKRDDIAWMGLELKGTNVVVSIVKSDILPEIINPSDYCDIIAKKSGIITNIIAQNGTSMVKIGDNVEQGDILIAGYMEGKYTEKRMVHSLGEIKAKVLYKQTKKIKLNQESYIKTGNTEHKYEVGFNNFKLKLYKTKSKFEYYQTEKEEKKLRLLENFYLPIQIFKITNKEEKKEQKKYNVQEATKIAINDLTQILDEQIENKQNIVNKNVEKEEKESSVIVTLIYEVEENIGENRKIE